jgi:hypothetical protein
MFSNVKMLLGSRTGTVQLQQHCEASKLILS